MTSGTDRAPCTPVRVDRRTTIKWLAATLVSAHAGCASDGKSVGGEIPRRTSLLGTAAAPGGPGYGTDPDLVNPAVPWPRTMTAAQRDACAALCDLVLPEDERSPAASAVGVQDFIDEWVSAPYEEQHRDRELILGGLEWLERQSRERFGMPFASAGAAQSQLVDEIASSGTALAEQARFFDRFRYLAVGAYYTTEAGMNDVGYIGNVPVTGAYPGPSEEALAHLAGVLRQLGLAMPA